MKIKKIQIAALTLSMLTLGSSFKSKSNAADAINPFAYCLNEESKSNIEIELINFNHIVDSFTGEKNLPNNKLPSLKNRIYIATNMLRLLNKILIDNSLGHIRKLELFEEVHMLIVKLEIHKELILNAPSKYKTLTRYLLENLIRSFQRQNIFNLLWEATGDIVENNNKKSSWGKITELAQSISSLQRWKQTPTPISTLLSDRRLDMKHITHSTSVHIGVQLFPELDDLYKIFTINSLSGLYMADQDLNLIALHAYLHCHWSALFKYHSTAFKRLHDELECKLKTNIDENEIIHILKSLHSSLEKNPNLEDKDPMYLQFPMQLSSSISLPLLDLRLNTEQVPNEQIIER